jgi:hypothetical protein
MKPSLLANHHLFDPDLIKKYQYDMLENFCEIELNNLYKQKELTQQKTIDSLTALYLQRLNCNPHLSLVEFTLRLINDPVFHRTICVNQAIKIKNVPQEKSFAKLIQKLGYLTADLSKLNGPANSNESNCSTTTSSGNTSFHKE